MSFSCCANPTNTHEDDKTYLNRAGESRDSEYYSASEETSIVDIDKDDKDELLDRDISFQDQFQSHSSGKINFSSLV